MATKKKSRPSRGRQSGARSRQSKAAKRKATRKPTPSQLMHRDAARGGLTPRDCNKAGFEPQTRGQTFERTGYNVTSYLIRYPDINGEFTDYWRTRYTEEIKGAFGATRKKPWRYRGPDDELPRFYFPLGVNWIGLAKDTTEPVVLTEGEKKAVKACKCGLPTISVPGVWAWRSKKKGIAAIPDFDLIEWKGRKVYLAFDSDLMTNPQVIAALNALAHELTMRGAKVVVKYLQ